MLVEDVFDAYWFKPGFVLGCVAAIIMFSKTPFYQNVSSETQRFSKKLYCPKS